MRSPHSLSVITLLSAATLAAPLDAHGGQYRGPGNVPPASGGRNAPAAPRPAGGAGGGSGAGASTGPSTPNAAPAAPRAASSGAAAASLRGVPVGEDTTRWQYWWEFHKDAHLQIKQAVLTDGRGAGGLDQEWMGMRASRPPALRPTDADVYERVLPAITRTMREHPQRDVVSSCLIALGKIGQDGGNVKILDELSRHLRAADQEIRETAALALGITRRSAAIPRLAALAEDSAYGRAMVESSHVDTRTRTFAIYGLGLVSELAKPGNPTRSTVIAVLEAVFADSSSMRRDLRIAAVHALRLAAPRRTETGPSAISLRQRAARLLARIEEQASRASDQVVRAHVLPTLAGLLDPEAPTTQRQIVKWTELLEEQATHQAVKQSAAMALGKVLSQRALRASDREAIDALLRYAKAGRDVQARHFAWVALGRIDSKQITERLLSEMRDAPHIERPWLGIALGRRATELPRDAEERAMIGKRLHQELTNARDPEQRAAFAVALGLAKHHDAADDLLTLLERYRHHDELAGYLCVSLALLEETKAVPLLRKIIAGATRRPILMRQAALALGRLGDKTLVGELCAQLHLPSRNVARLGAVSAALGLIGDRRSLDSLLQLLADEKIPELSRAFAVVALGGVADRSPLPWNASLASAVNYRATVPTLTNGLNGILDIL